MSPYPSKKTPDSLGFERAQVYAFVDYDPEEHEEIHGRPPMKNVFAAVIHVAKLIQAKGFIYALLGGTALAALGAMRETMDADIATNAKMNDLWKVLDDSRVILPDTRLLSEMIRLFVHTGPAHGDDFITDNYEVQVDVMVAGGGIVPRRLEEHLQKVDLQVGTLTVELTCLASLTLLRAKLSTFSARDGNQDFEDCIFLLDANEFPPEAIDDLDETHRRNFVDSELFGTLDPKDARIHREKLRVQADSDAHE